MDPLTLKLSLLNMLTHRMSISAWLTHLRMKFTTTGVKIHNLLQIFVKKSLFLGV